MTEIPPEPYNHENTESFLAEDVRHRGDWNEIASLSIEVDSLLLSARSDIEAYDTVGRQLQELTQRIGENYISGLAEVKGLGRRIQFSEPNEDGLQVYVASASLHEVSGEDGEPVGGTYEGVDIYKIDGQWQLLLTIELIFNEEETDDDETRSGLYGFSPYKLEATDTGDVRDHIEELFLTIDDEHDIDVPSAILVTIGKDACELVASDVFLKATPFEQREELDEIIDRLQSSLSHHIADDKISVWFTDTYHELATWLGGDTPMSVDPSQWDDSPQHLLQGTITGFSYIDLLDTPVDKQLTLEDFTVGDGAPSLIVAGEEGSVYYVPIDKVTDIARVVITDDSQEGESDDYYEG